MRRGATEIRVNPGTQATSAPGVRRQISPMDLQDGQVALELVGRDVGLEVVPLLTLVADQELVDVLPEGVSEDLRAVGELDRLGKVRRERADPGRAALLIPHLVDVVR